MSKDLMYISKAVIQFP